MFVKRSYLSELLSYGVKLGAETLYVKGHEVVLFSPDNAAIFGKIPFDGDIQFAIPLLQFNKIVSSVKDEEVDIEVEERKVNIMAGKMKCSIQKLNITFPWFDSSKEFYAIPGITLMVKLASQFCSSGSSNDILSGVYISGKNVFSSDKKRIFWGQIKGIQKEINIIIPSKFVKVLDFSFDKVCVNKNTVLFQKSDENIIASFPLLGGKYPDCINIYKKTIGERKPVYIDFVLNAINIVERAKLFSEKVCIKENNLIAKSQIGNYEETIIESSFHEHPVKWTDSLLLSDCIRLTNKVCFLDKPNEPLIFKGHDYRIILGVIIVNEQENN